MSECISKNFPTEINRIFGHNVLRKLSRMPKNVKTRLMMSRKNLVVLIQLESKIIRNNCNKNKVGQHEPVRNDGLRVEELFNCAHLTKN